MSVTKVFNHGLICWQSVSEDGIPELPIVGHVDAGGTICFDQEGHSIVLNPASANDFIKMVKRLQKDSQAKR